MDEITARVKKWGSSLGIIIPAAVARRHGLHADDTIRVRIEPRELTTEDVTGFLRDELADLDWESVDRELATGWGDD